jgi:ankyrin repeat protein
VPLRAGLWLAGCDEVFSTVFTNPYMGMAWFMEPDDPGLRDSSSRAGYAIGMQNAAAADTSSAQYFLCLGSEGENLDKEICSMLESEHIRCLKWNDKLEAGVQQLEIVMALDDAGADIDAVTLPDCNSPLMIAAAAGNAALADLLCRLGADTEQRRYAAVLRALQSDFVRYAWQ